MSFLLDVNRYAEVMGVWLSTYGRHIWDLGKRGTTFGAYMGQLSVSLPVSSYQSPELSPELDRTGNWQLATGNGNWKLEAGDEIHRFESIEGDCPGWRRDARDDHQRDS